MRVALFVHCFFPDHFYGTETYTLQIAKNLQAMGHDVTVVAGIFQGEPRRARTVTRYVYDDVPVIAIDKNFEPHANLRETYWQETMRPYLRRVLDSIHPDMVHVTHLVNHTGVLLGEAKSAGYPVVATLTDFFGFCYNNKLEAADGALCAGPNGLRSNCVACHMKASGVARPQFGYGWAGLLMRAESALGWPKNPARDALVSDLVARPHTLRQAYTAYDAMIAPTNFLRDAYVRNGFPPQRIHLGRFGVDLDRAAKRPAPDGAPLTVGFIGQIAAHKGVDLLLTAAQGIPADKLRLLIYGPANQDPAYMARLRSLATPAVEFRGTFAPSAMAETLAQMDVLAIPSTWYENSPLVLLNALASHTPVLVADVAGLTEFLTGGDGWTFRRGDAGDLRRVLVRLVEQPGPVRQASARTRYDRTTAAMTAEVADLYARVMAERGSPATQSFPLPAGHGARATA
jgi:glycosyltransferase involved in cell wall biosynthesis